MGARIVAIGGVAAVVGGAAACGLDAVGTFEVGGGATPADGGGPSSPSDSSAAPVDAASSDGATDAQLDALGDAGPLAAPDTCAALLARDPSASSAIHMVDPDGPDAGASEFPVRCDMITDGGGWTLVGRELANETQQFKYLAADSGNPANLAAGTSGGLIGKRFIGKYTQVWLEWGSGSFIRFTKSAGFDLFANVLNTSVAITNVSSSDSTFIGWIAGAGGAKLCVASRQSDVRPGDTSWAIKPQDDNNTDCGCSSMNWVGRGAFYSGVSNSTSCGDYGGGWAGVRASGVQKGGVVPTSETRIWIR